MYKVNYKNNKVPVHYGTIPGKELITLLDSSIAYLDDMHKHLSAINAQMTDEYLRLDFDHIEINKSRWPASFEFLLSDQNILEKDVDLASLTFLANLEACNRTTLINILNNVPVAGSEIYLTSPIANSANGLVSPNTRSISPRFLGRIYTVQLIDGAYCNTCNVIRSKDDMPRHKLHPECQIEADRLAVETAGMKRVHGIDDIIAVRSANIEHRMVSEYWATWVPAWVHEAINIYNKSGPDGQFAGMTLAQFLENMKPEVENGKAKED